MKVIHGDNIEILKQYPDNYFDAIVTDAPYGLGKEPNATELMKDWIDKGYHEVGCSGFMGKEWDAFIPQPIFWKEIFRVLKHGGHVLAFYGTRTYDWGVMAMRFAGFEIRDCIQWLYGSGFPKSYNVAKGIEGKIINGSSNTTDFKKLKGEREVIKSGYTKMQFEQGNRPANYNDENAGNSVVNVEYESDQAKEWDGWGSALKPANEPIVLARKPLEKGLSIADNVLKWGTGAINIDGCRVTHNEPIKIMKAQQGGNKVFGQGGRYEETTELKQNGRFPANLILTHHPECECVGTKKVKSQNGGNNGTISNNVYGKFNGEKNNDGCGFADENGEETIENWNCHQDCPIKILDQQSGESQSSQSMRGEGGGGDKVQQLNYRENSLRGHTDKGGASRFFYIAKASKSERNKGLDLEKWFYNLELITESCSFTEQNLFIWEQEEQNQSMDLNLEVQPKKDILEGTALLVSDKECCTTLNGKSITALFPMAIKFTTKTGLSQTIELKTLNYYQHLNTSDCIVDVLETNKANGLNLAENVGLKNLLKLIFTKDKMEFPLGVKIVAKKTQQLINVKDAWQKSNIHSTVKPIKLMQYLVRLVTPPNGIVLDPFCGSGTTGIACKLEGFEFVGLEQDAEYCKIAQARIDNYVEDKKESKKSIKPKEDTDLKQQTLF